ncbi:MAG: hypothetical protein R2754_13680 [Microthrixaceae bacterium]
MNNMWRNGSSFGSRHAPGEMRSDVSIRWRAVAMALILVAGSAGVVLGGSGPAGAQPTPPGYGCEELADFLDNARQTPTTDEEYQQQLDAGRELLALLKDTTIGREELGSDIANLEAFIDSSATVIADAGGIANLTGEQLNQLNQEGLDALRPFERFLADNCTPPNVDAILYPPCEWLGNTLPTLLEVTNNESFAVRVVAGSDSFMVEGGQSALLEVPAGIGTAEVTIDGYLGLVTNGSCDDLREAMGPDDLAALILATFFTGCPNNVPPRPPRLSLALNDEGQTYFGPDGPAATGPFLVSFQIDGVELRVELPAGVELDLEVGAPTPVVTVEGAPVTITINSTACAPDPPSGPDSNDNAPSSDDDTPPAADPSATPLKPSFAG